MKVKSAVTSISHYRYQSLKGSATIGAGRAATFLAGNPRMTYTAFFQIQRPAFLVCAAGIIASAVIGGILAGTAIRFQQTKAVPDTADHANQGQYFWERE